LASIINDMKNIYRFTFLLAMLLYISSGYVAAQQNAFSIGSVATSCTGSPTVTLPVKVQNLTNVGSFQFTVKFDPTKFTYQSHSALSPAFLAGNPLFGWDDMTHIGAGQITFSWLRFGGLTLVPDSTIFTITLNYLGGGTGTVIYDLAGPSSFDVTDPAVNSVPFTQTGGSVSTSDIQPPVVVCPPSVTVQSNTPVAIPSASATSVTDNCGVVGSVYQTTGTTMTMGSGTNATAVAFAPGSSVITFGATDAASNFGTCSMTVTVQAITPPGPDTLTIIASAGPLTCGQMQMYVDILANNFDSLGSLQYTVQWNPALFSFDSVGMPNTALNLNSTNYNLTQTAGGFLGFSWTTLNPATPYITLPNGARLVRVYFHLLTTGNINSAITFGSTPVPIEAFNNAVPPGYEVPVNVLSGTVLSVDTTMPSLTCPPSQTFSVPQGQTNVTVNGLIATGSDLCDPSLTYSYQLIQNGNPTVQVPNSNNASGAYPIGLTVVAFTATDDAGNSNICFTNIQVNPANPVVIYVDTADISCNGTGLVDVNIRVRNFADVVGAQFVIAWDEIVLDFDTISFLATGINSQSFNFGNFNNVNNGFLQYIDGNINGWPNIPDDGILFTMRFFLPGGNINEVIDFINLPGFPIQVYDANINLLNVTTMPGGVISNDTLAPVFTNCPANVTVNTPGLECTTLYNWPKIIVTDDCGPIQSLDSNFTSHVFNTGTHTIIYTAEDAAGNTKVCSFVILVKDAFLPAFLTPCPQNINVNAGVNCIAAVNWLAPSAFDNCDQALVPALSSFTPGQTFVSGPTTVVYTATDLSGNTISCSFVVTVNETTAPIIACPSDTTIALSAGACSAPVTWAAPTATDNCTGMVAITGTHASGVTLPTGFTIVEFTATDMSSNTATCSFVVTITEPQAPSVLCPANMTLSVDNSVPGNCGATAIWTAATAADNCPGAVILNASINSGSFLPAGLNTIRYTATDASGNTATCTFTVQVIDNVAPVFTSCPPAQMFTLHPDSCTVLVAWQDITPANVIEPCGIATFINVTNFTSPHLFGVGNHVVTYIAIDNAGNVANCSFQVTVRDTVPPVLATCPSDTVLLSTSCTVPFNFVLPGATDNCDNNVTVTVAPASGLILPAGSTTIYKIVARDNYSNFDSCSFTVQVAAALPPTVSCPASVTQVGCSWVASWAAPTIAGFCSQPVNLTVSPYDIGTTIPSGVHTITYTGIDNAGITASCSFTVTVTDPIGPTIVCPQDVVVDVSGGMTADPSNFVTTAVPISGCDSVQLTFTNPVASDNCGNVFNVQTSGLGSGAIFAVGVTNMAYTATDATGNSATCAFSITVDSIASVLSIATSSNPVCPGEPLIISVPSIAGATYAWSGPAATYPNAPVLTINPVTAAAAGLYAVTVTNNGCIYTSGAGVPITIATAPMAVLDYFPLQTNQADTLRTLANDTGLGNGVTYTLLNPPVGVTQSANGNLFFAGSDKVGDIEFFYVICSEDCITACDTTVVTINVKDSPCIYEPNTLTPNGDGLNDEWIIPCLEFERYPNNSVVIYNQWGDKVFSASPYVPFPKQTAWNGGLNNDIVKQVPDGTYYYVFRPSPTATPRTGFIEIFR
jgi:gliding motility-associated-like protein